MKSIVSLIFLSGISTFIYAQGKKEIEALSSRAKTLKTFPLDYKIVLPRLEPYSWDNDFDKYYSFVTPALMKTQASLSYWTDSVRTMINFNSALPHAELDTATMIKNKEQLTGIWRMITYRSMRFNDSVDIKTKKYYRLADTLLSDKSKDDVFATFNDSQFRLFVKEQGKSKFKKAGSSKYSIEGQRYLMLYKLFKSGSGVSQIGIDEHGYLILNYPQVIEQVKKGVYLSYYAIIEQYIFEKIE